jgi:hypothetical protein
VVAMIGRLVVALTLAFWATAVSAQTLDRREEDDIKYGFDQYADQCTSIGVGPKATVDGST